MGHDVSNGENVLGARWTVTDAEIRDACNTSIIRVSETSKGDWHWTVWRQDTNESPVTGRSNTLADAKTAALDKARELGLDITVEDDDAPFTIEAFTYFVSPFNDLVVALPRSGDKGLWQMRLAGGAWRECAGPTEGWRHEPDPPHRHPDDPANAMAEVRALIERVGTDVVRAVLEEAR